MKNKRILKPLLLLTSLLLVSCTTGETPSSSSSSPSSEPSSSTGESTSTSSESVSSSEESSSGISSETSTPISSSSEESSSSPSSTTEPYIGPDRTVTLYAINDFHGRIYPNEEEYEAGIVRVGGFMKAMGQEENTLILCTGDLWQGTLESNYNRGKLLTDVMNIAEFDAFTLGNHEFDWGPDYIRENRLRSDPETGYSTPFINSNIYNFDISTKTTLDFAELGDPYVIHQLENGLKVGIVGGIGYNQITDITSTFADEFVFVNGTMRTYNSETGSYNPSIYQSLSDELRSKGCDVVILDHHGGQEELVSQHLTEVSTVTGKRYYDGIFCAHTHNREKSMENGVPLVQGACNGTAYSTMTLNVAGDGTGEVTCEDYDYPYTSTIDMSYDDSAIAALVESYGAETTAVGSEILTTLTGTWSSRGEIPNLVCESVAKFCAEQNIDIDIAICNQARANLVEGELTYSDLFAAVPFDNEIYVLEASGTDIVSRARGNYFYRVREEAFDRSATYTAAVIDYLAVHRSSARDYDFFPSANWDTAYVLKQDGEVIHYRDITANNLRSADSFSNADYSSSLDHFNRNKIYSDVVF